MRDALSHGESIGAVQVTERRVFGTDNALLRVKQFHADGRVTAEVVLLKRTPDGWRRDIGWTPTPSNNVPAAAAGRKE